jgi:leader peptidase (prepilin peptidase)/N-methyltransferase
LLPDVVKFPLIVLSVILAGVAVASSHDPLQTLSSIAGSIAILSGLYLVLWWASKGQWVGFGDVKLGLALGLLLADWRFAFLTLFLANFIGSLVVLPGLLTKKLTRTTQVPFGPLLILGFAISLLLGHAIIDGYDQFSIWLSTTMLML